jgi:phosphohistidine phosphatase
VTRRLVLVRHAKAEQGGSDLERTLAKRGRADAAALGEWLSEHGIVPDRVVISPSRRTRQTWELAAPPGSPEPELDERIYDNTVEDLLAVIHSTPADADTLVIVGHNPSVGELAGGFDPSLREYPTSATAVFALDEWEQAPSGRLTASVVPRG